MYVLEYREKGEVRGFSVQYRYGASTTTTSTAHYVPVLVYLLHTNRIEVFFFYRPFSQDATVLPVTWYSAVYNIYRALIVTRTH